MVHLAVNLSTQEREHVDGHWLVLSYPRNPTIRLNACVIDRILSDESSIYMVAGEFKCALTVLSASVAAHITASLTPYTRSNPINGRESYLIARQCLEAAPMGLSKGTLFVGDIEILVEDGILHIGEFRWHIDDVNKCLKAEGELQWPGAVLQAALAMLVVAVRYRQEDPDRLSLRIADYESRLVVLSPDTR
jgi:hypothetical protein